MIDFILLAGCGYAAYAIVKSVLCNGTAWATYQPKHKKMSRLARFIKES